MRTLPAGMQTHLDTGATTLCWCWKVTRNDSVVQGFTDHDNDLVFGGVTYKASSGFTASELADSLGLNVDSIDVESALSSETLNEDDLAAGIYDGAAVEIYRVNWADVSQRIIMRSGSIGEVRRQENAFVAEIRGIAHELNQKRGRLYQLQCDADLGDSRCTVDLNDSAFKGTGTVDSIVELYKFTVTGLDTYEDGWFTGGLLSWTSGNNNNLRIEVKWHYILGGIVTVELWQLPPFVVAPGDDFTITAGCDKLFDTCKVKFSNTINFRGFPHIPGNRFIMRYPNPTEVGNDGGSMNN